MTKPVSGTTEGTQAATVPPSPKQVLVALVETVTWHLDFLTGAADDIGTALDAVLEGAEFDDAEVMNDIDDAVEAVRSALGHVNEVERAIEQLRAVTAAVSDDEAAPDNDID